MNEQQRRIFSRVRFFSRATIATGGQTTECEVRDLSLKGALLVTERGLQLRPTETCVLEIQLDDADTLVRMDAEVAHCEDNRIGLVCRSIDLDSITHLRRLLELNLGDAHMLEREFSALIAG